MAATVNAPLYTTEILRLSADLPAPAVLDRENGRDAWLKAIETDHLAWTQVSDLKFWKNEVAQLYGIQSIPQNFLVGPDGRIVAKNVRGEDLGKTLAAKLPASTTP